ncbi:hypothetical protein ACHAW5_005860 [Stephanodiscus triporus]|uniref:Uncharacterized protein n=1 Tax=Stephanodiscus triporus TaxID=2934178 RepID=A0ABD3MXL5_9STRA
MKEEVGEAVVDAIHREGGIEMIEEDATSGIVEVIADEGGKVTTDHTSNGASDRTVDDAVSPPSGDGDVVIAGKDEDVSDDAETGHGGDGSEKTANVSSTVGKGEKPSDVTSTEGGAGSAALTMPDGGSERGGDGKMAARSSSPEKANPSPRNDDPPAEEGGGGSSPRENPPEM